MITEKEGNTSYHTDPEGTLLKLEVATLPVQEDHPPATVINYLGFTWTSDHHTSIST